MQCRCNLFRIGRRDAKFICVTILLTTLLRVCLHMPLAPSHDPRGTVLHNMDVEPEYWRANRYSTLVKECPMLNACRGGNETADCTDINECDADSSKSDAMCRGAYTGPMCQLCKVAYACGRYI
jgi:hypothetical protein